MVHPRVSGPSVFRVERPSTLDLVAIELREAIFSGALPVGSPIVEAEIASQLGVSRSPLREASQRLVQEGLLTPHPGRGLYVPRIEAGQVADLYRARSAVESEAIRLLTARAHPGPLNTLETALEDLLTASKATDARSIDDADLAFHHTLVKEAGSARLSRYMATLVIETRVATLSHPGGYQVRRPVCKTYRQILSALAAGDADGAIAALRTQFEDAVAHLTSNRASDETMNPAPKR